MQVRSQMQIQRQRQIQIPRQRQIQIRIQNQIQNEMQIQKRIQNKAQNQIRNQTQTQKQMRRLSRIRGRSRRDGGGRHGAGADPPGRWLFEDALSSPQNGGAMRIALIQQRAEYDQVANLARGLEAFRRAARNGAEMVCFAELAFSRFHPQKPAGKGFRELAESIPGPTTDAFSALARELGVVAVLNLYERHGDECFDSSPVIDADGTILGVTRMLHITDYPCFHEQGYYTPGDSGVPVFDTAVGRVGVSICYDRHYPEVMRGLAVAGAEVVVVPQAGAVGEWPEGLYEAEMRVAAFQNGYFTALVNRVGPEECLEFAGESFVCAPDGTVIARAGAGTDETLLADLDLGLVEKSHARQLFLRDRRPELYSEWLGPDGGRKTSG
jgi:N-carbamoylputrescine amidase